MTYRDQLGKDADYMQALIVSHPPVKLLCDSRTDRILTGRYRGRLSDDAYVEISDRHVKAGHFTHCERTDARPWWRFGRPTYTLRITVIP